MPVLPLLLDNPIMLRELRRRMRGKAMILFLIIYVALVCGVSFLLLMVRSATLDVDEGLNYVAEIADVGRSMFYAVIWTQGILVLLVAPAITAGMVTAERERQTFDFLRVTTLTPAMFVFGGLLSTLMYVLLVQVCALPVLCIPFLYGGMSPGEVLGWSGMLLGSSLVMCSLGIYFSSVSEKTRSAQGAMVMVTVALGWFSAFFLIANMATSGAGGVTAPLWNAYPLFNGAVTIPGWSLFVAAAVCVSALTVLVACRKIYDRERRVLNYTQYLVFCLAVCGALAGALWGLLNEFTVYLWVIAGGSLLMGAAFVFCTGEVVVGNDLWRLKRRIPPLRVVDESFLYVLVLTVAWSVATVHFFRANLPQAPADALAAVILCIASPAVFFGVLARLLVLGGGSAKNVTKVVAVVAVTWLLALPAIFMVAGATTGGQGLLYELRGMSPYFVMGDAVKAIAKPHTPPINWLETPGPWVAALVAGLAAVLFMPYVAVYLRHLRGKDFRYDLPG